MLALLYLSATFCVLVALAWSWTAGTRKTVPGSNVVVCPGSKPVLGHFLSFLAAADRMYDYMADSVRSMGYRTCAFLIPMQPPLIMITSPQNLEYVLKTNFDNFEKGEFFFSRTQQLLGHGIFTQDGASWYWQRKLASRIFSVQGFKKYVNVVFADKLNKLLDHLSAAAASGETLDLQDLMYAFTLDAFAQLGFGADPGALQSKDKLPFAKAFDDAQAIINDRFWIPAWSLVERLNGSAMRMTNDLTVIKGFAMDIISKRRAHLAAAAAAEGHGSVASDDTVSIRSSSCSSTDSVEADTKRSSETNSTGDCGSDEQDLLTLFIEAKSPNGNPLSDQQLVDTVLNFLLAGRDTTAQALSWTMYELMRHPKAEEELLAELAEVLGDASLGTCRPAEPPAGPGGQNASTGTAAAAAAAPGNEASLSGVGSISTEGAAQPSYDLIRQLRYTKACLMEALRLHPVVPSDVKFAVADDKLPDGSIIPKGAQVAYAPYIINRLPSFWGPDAETFRPERWLEMGSAPSPYHFPTFNAGPRLCLGQRLAELEGVYVLAGMLRRFRFKLVGCKELTYAASTTLPISGGLPVGVSIR